MDSDTARPQAHGGNADSEQARQAVSEELEALRAKHPGRMFGYRDRRYWSAGRPGSGIVRAGTAAEVGVMVRQEEWDQAHPGGKFVSDSEGLLTWEWNGEPFRGPHVPGALLDELDEAGRQGLCPAHGPFAGRRP